MTIEQNGVNALIARYQHGIALFEEAVRGAAKDEVDLVPAPGKWTIRQITCHMADSEAVAAVRYRMIAAQPGSSLSAFDQEQWADQLVYSQQPLEEAVTAYVTLRRYNCALLRVLPWEAWSRTAVHVERGEQTLFKMVEHNALHAETHAGQVWNIRKKATAPADRQG